MNYIHKIKGMLAARLPDCEPGLINVYALLVLVAGRTVDEENVHDAWSVWRNLKRPDHPSLIPFVGLDRDVQELGAPYAAAIRDVASTWMGACECGHPPMEHSQRRHKYDVRGCWDHDCDCSDEPSEILERNLA